MKFGYTARLILVIGIVAVAVVMLYRLYLQQGLEQVEVNIQLVTAQGLLPKLVSDKEDSEGRLTQLEGDLTEATSRLSEAKAYFPASVQSIEYDEVLFRMADDRDLEIVTLTASEPADLEVEVELETDDQDQEVDNVTYSVTSFMVEVEGKATELAFDTAKEYEEYISQTVADILDFISDIANGDDFTTATVKLVNISMPEPMTDDDIDEMKEQEMEEEELIQEFEGASATINLEIYGYEGK